MKNIRDLFSGHSSLYKKFRPTYPAEMIEYILSNTKGRHCAWDCATGNGQVAQMLAPHFSMVYATDISENQLSQAPQVPNIHYSLQRGESTNFEDNSFDLIAVGQAIHWFDIPAFNEEARRVSKPGGVLAVWGYGLFQLGGPMDRIISHFYSEVVGPYWDGERRHIDSRYGTIALPLQNTRDLGNFSIKRNMDPRTLHGYLSSWSSVQNYIKKHGENPVDQLMTTLSKHWVNKRPLEVTFPLFGTLGEIRK